MMYLSPLDLQPNRSNVKDLFSQVYRGLEVMGRERHVEVIHDLSFSPPAPSTAI